MTMLGPNTPDALVEVLDEPLAPSTMQKKNHSGYRLDIQSNLY